MEIKTETKYPRHSVKYLKWGEGYEKTRSFTSHPSLAEKCNGTAILENGSEVSIP